MANIVYMDRVIWTGVFGRMNESDPTAPKLSNHTVFPIASGTKILTVSDMLSSSKLRVFIARKLCLCCCFYVDH